MRPQKPVRPHSLPVELFCMVTVSGSVEDVVFYNPENGYSVLALNCEGDMLTVVGTFPELAVGEEIQVSGEYANHPRFGQQLKVTSFQRILPVDVVGIERYLASGLIKGIGSHFAQQLVRKFGVKTLEIIDKEPARLMEVPGIGEHKIQLIVSSWREQKNVYEVMTFLQSIEVTTNLAIKICKQYGAHAVNIVRTDPYRLAQDIHGIGFTTADRIAATIGLPKDHLSRIKAGFVYILRELAAEGHVYAPRPLLEQKAVELLALPLQPVRDALNGCAKEAKEQLHATALFVEPQGVDNPLNPDDDRVYLLPYYAGEVGAAERLAWLIKRGERRSRISGSTLLLPTLIADDQITEQQK